MTYLAPVGMLGGGFTERWFEQALADHDLDFIAIDSGSTDGGANNLGGDLHFFSRDACKRDLRLLIKATRRLGIPLLVGSAGGSGGNWNLNWLWEITQEIAVEEDLHFTTALIPAEVDRDALVAKHREGRIRPLFPAPEISEATLTDTHRIVGMMGQEPFIAALEGGADVVLAGRASDSALFSAIPVMRGFDAGLAWHAAKIMECGGAAVKQMTKPEGMVCRLTDEWFELEPVSPEQGVSALSVAAHALYETADPYVMHEPGGAIHLEDVRYEEISDRVVRVRGSRWEPAPYSIKLEGAALVGYRAAALGGITDPMILRDLDDWLAKAKDGAIYNLTRSLGEEVLGECTIAFRVYGRNAVLGDRETRPFDGDHEVGVLILVHAPTEQLARDVVATVSHSVLHTAVPAWHGLVSNLAFPFAPHEIELGPAYSFVLNHVVEVDDPLELYSIDYREL